MSYNIWDVIKDYAKGNIEYVSNRIQRFRLNICNGCEKKNHRLNICNACGCYLPAKTSLVKSSCPLNKW